MEKSVKENIHVHNEYKSTLIDKNGMIQYLPKSEHSLNVPMLTCPAGVPSHIIDTDVEVIQQRFLSNPGNLPLHAVSLSVGDLKEYNIHDILDGKLCENGTTLGVDRDVSTGAIIDTYEEPVESLGLEAFNSTSMTRRIIKDGNSDVRGSRSNLPFWPGGMDPPPVAEEKISTNAEINMSLDFANIDLLSTPRGFNFNVDKEMQELEKRMTSELPDLEENEVPRHLLEKQHKTQEVQAPEHRLEQLSLDVNTLLSKKVKSASFEILVEQQNVEKQKVDVAVVDKTELRPLNKLYSSVDEIITLDNVSSRVNWTGEDHEYAVVLDCHTPMPPIEKLIEDCAFKFDFELDVFQKQAILCLERNQNVFVSAHTSAGKTVVAEYAIALTMRRMTKTIYTSPIKALSNQKYRDFKNTFGDVGLVTGDVQVDPKASCLIMTTEILRSMLYNGSDVIRDLEFVVFDEVHYINNEERGVVWEEVLIMLPSHIKLILLSATVPNTVEFASWVGRTKQKPVFCVSTSKRPVPLEHFLYTGYSKETEDNLFSIVTKEDRFDNPSFNKAVGLMSKFDDKRKKNYELPYWKALIKMLKKRRLTPAVFFIFSRARIDNLSTAITGAQICSSEESAESHNFFTTRVLRKLSKSDQGLPQVTSMLKLVKNGYGIHHSGVLPILKEAVEFLFCKGNIKVLLATETFAMGINMPAKCVVFDSISKHDGICKRLLLAGEFIQMAGRAGRRGIDTVGSVILMCKPTVPSQTDLAAVLMGEPTHLKSQFRLTYSMILNIIRVEKLHVEDMMKRSFAEYANQKNITKNQRRLVDIELTLKKMKCKDVASLYDFQTYFTLTQEINLLQNLSTITVLDSSKASRIMESGRVVIMKTSVALEDKYSDEVANNRKWRKRANAISKQSLKVNCGLTVSPTDLTEAEKREDYVDEMFLVPAVIVEGSMSNGFTVLVPHGGAATCAGGFLFTPEVTSQPKFQLITREDIYAVTDKILKYKEANIMDCCKAYVNDMSRRLGESALFLFQELVALSRKQAHCGFSLLNPVDLKSSSDIELYQDQNRLKSLLVSLREAFPVQTDMDFRNKYREICRIEELNTTRARLEYLSSDESLSLLPEMRIRISVLRSLKYFQDLTSIHLKGRVACEITSEEFILSEVIFDGIFTNLNPLEITSILSGIIHHKKKSHETPVDVKNLEITDNLRVAIGRCLDLGVRLAEVQKEKGLQISQFNNYEEVFNFELVEIVFNWTKGDMSFSEIMQNTHVQEGVIVRVIQRINELLNDLRKAGTIFGDPNLVTNVTEATRLIKRDIVFAASLYI